MGARLQVDVLCTRDQKLQWTVAYSQIYVVSASVLLKRTKERAENGFSAFVQGGFMKTVSYQTPMVKINFVPYVEL